MYLSMVRRRTADKAGWIRDISPENSTRGFTTTSLKQQHEPKP